jgi:hypothetical protein
MKKLLLLAIVSIINPLGAKAPDGFGLRKVSIFAKSLSVDNY